MQGSVLQPEHHNNVRKAAWWSSFIIVGCFALARRLTTIGVALFLVFVAWQYSAPPLRLKEVPLLDSLSNGLIVFLCAYLGQSLGTAKLRDVPAKLYILAMVCSGVHALGAAADLEADLQAGQSTIATFFGRRLTALIVLIT